MKKYTIIILCSLYFLFIFVSVSNAQILNVETSGLGPDIAYNGYIDDNDHLVLASFNGIKILDDTTVLNTISTRDKGRVFPGRFGNIVYGYDTDTVVSWNQGNESFFVIDSAVAPTGKGVSKLIQLANGQFLIMTRRSSLDVLLLDANGASYFNNINYNVWPYFQDGPIIEYETNKFFFRSSRFENVIITYDHNTGQLTEIKDLAYFPDIPNFIITYTKGPGNKIYIMHEDGFATWQNGTITHSITFQSMGIDLDYPHLFSNLKPQYISNTSPIDNRMYAISNQELFVYDGDTVIAYDSLDGFKIPINNAEIEVCDFNSSGVMHVVGGNNNPNQQLFLSKIDTSPIASLKNESASHLKIYPNPANDIIHINAKSGIESIKVLNIANGKVLYEYQGINSKEITLKTNNWKRGMYLFKIKSANSLSVHKQIIE